MKNINEDIRRIKKLMNLNEGEQLYLDLDFGGKDQNKITINSPEFTKTFKEKVFFILKDIYGNTNWSNQKGKGTRGQGGFVNIYTVYDLMKEKGLDDYEKEGGERGCLRCQNVAVCAQVFPNETFKTKHCVETTHP